MYSVTDVAVTHRERNVLRIDRLDIATDTFTAVIGHNGSGKSTLMNLLARQLVPSVGEIRLNGRSLSGYSHRALARLIGYLPQRLPETAGLTVRELCGLGRFPWRGTFGSWRTEDSRMVDAALEETDMTAFGEQLVDSLSGGERQRAWIAMLLAQDAPILLLDEPTAALDVAHQIELLALLARLSRTSRRGVIAILHDVNMPARFARRIIALKEGAIAFDGGPQDFMRTEVLSGLYGVDFTIVDHPSRPEPVAVLG